MADILQDTYSKALRFTKVLFQRGKDVINWELNELQDIMRVAVYDALKRGVGTTDLNPGSNDTGYKIVGTGASNEVTVQSGYLFCDGIPIELSASTTLTGFTTPVGADRTDVVYVQVYEEEVADPNEVSELGETTRRRKLQTALAISETGLAGVPADSAEEIWAGGTRYFPIASIARTDGVATIASGDVTDLRNLYPAAVIAQTTRQSNHQVQALVASAIETPDGTLIPKQNQFVIDVDPDDNFAETGAYFWARINRDTTPYSLFKSELISATVMRWTAGKLLQIVDGTIEANAAVSGVSSIPLTSTTAADGDAYPRMMGRPFLGSAVTPPTIVKNMNRHWTVTCGDGSVSFGDFNGATAVQDALSFFENFVRVASSMDGIRIQLKKGTYDVPAITATMAANYSIVIEGEDRDEVTLSHTGTSLLSGTGAALTLRDLTISYTSGISRSLVTVTGGVLRMERVSLVGGRLNILNPAASSSTRGRPTVYCEDCHFSVRAAATGSCVDIVVSTTGTYDGFYFNRCVFLGATANAVFRIRELGAAAASRLRNVIFEDCTMYLGGCTDDGFGNPDDNCGVLEVEETSAAERLTVENIEFVDCNVYGWGGASPGGTSHMLMYLRTGTGASANVIIEKLAIRGGMWVCPDAASAGFSSVFTPFYAGPHQSGGGPSGKLKSVVISDVTFGYISASGGAGTGNTYGLAPAEVAVNSQAMVHISADDVRMEKVCFIGLTAASQSGDLSLANVKTLTMRDVEVIAEGWAAGVDSAPNSRVYLAMDTGYNSRLVDRLVVESIGGETVCSSALISVVPNGHLHLSNCGSTSVTGGPTFRLNGSTELENQGLMITGAKVSNSGGFFKYANSGGASSGNLKDLTITDCISSTSSAKGIDISFTTGGTTWTVENVHIGDNTIRLSGNEVACLVAPSVWNDDSSLVVSGNSVETGAGASAYGIQIGQTGVDDVQGITAFGNVCRGDDRHIRLLGNLVAAAGRWPRGLNSGWDLSGGVAIVYDDTLLTNGTMLYNDAVLVRT